MIRRSFIWLAVLILLAALLLRVVALMGFPAQWLEAMHIYRAHLTLQGFPFDHPISMRKWLSVPALAYLLRPQGPESLWIGRAFSALLGVLSTACGIGLGRALFGRVDARLDGRAVGLLAGALYAVLPMAVFHERQTLSDPLLGALGALMMLAAVHFARRPGLALGLLMGLLLAGLYLTKISALPFFLLPGLAVLLYTPRGAWPQAAAFYGLGAAVALALIGVAYYFYYLANPQDYASFGQAVIRQVAGLTPAVGSPDAAQQSTIWTQLNDLRGIVYYFFGPLIVVLAGLGIFAAWRGGDWRSVTYIFFPAVIFLLPVLLSSAEGDLRESFLPGRYVFPNALPLIVLSAAGAAAAISVYRYKYGVARKYWNALALFGVALLMPSLVFDARLILTPQRAPLPQVDRREYLTGYNTGRGQAEAAHLLLQAAEEAPARALTNGSPVIMQAYTGHANPRAGVQRLLDEDDQAEVLSGWLGAGDQVYIVEQEHSSVQALETGALGLELDVLASYDVPSGVWRISQVEAVAGPAAPAIFDARAPRPDQMTADYAQINAGVGPYPVIVFPGGQSGAVTGAQAVPLARLAWPLTGEAAAAALEEALPAGGLADVVIVDEENTDPERHLITALHEKLYWVEEARSGLIQRQRFAVGPREPAFTPVDAVWEDVIHLEEAALIDEAVGPGGAVRVALRWRADAPIGDPYTVFIHVFEPGGTLVAQHLTQPGNGLYPMTSWEPGQVIEERHALLLPDWAPPGEYEVWVGISDEARALRLRVTQAAEGGENYIVLGRFTVE